MKKMLQFSICIVLFSFFLGELHAQTSYFFDGGGSGSFAGWQARTGYYTSKAGIPVADIDPKYANRSSLFVFKNPLIPFNLIPYQITLETGATRCFREISDARSDYRFTLLDSSTLSGNNKFDGYTNYHLPKIPPGYRYVAKIGNVCNQAEAEGLIYEFTPTTAQDMLVVKYANVFLSPHNGSSEAAKQQNPPFELSIEIKNPFTGEWEITSASRCAYSFVNASEDIINIDTAYHNDGITSGGAVVYYKTWTTIGIDLSQLAQSNVSARLLVTSGDCSPGGHWGYSYVTGMLTNSRPYLDYSKICQNPDSDIVGSISMAEGFKYEWTIKDSSTVLSTERVFNVPENLMDSSGQREFTCHFLSARTDYPDSLKARCIGTPKKQDKFVENYRAVVSMVDTALENQVMHFQSTSRVFNGAIIVPNGYEWNFGDGTPIVTGVGDSISHKYAKPGTYNVSLLVHTNHSVTGVCASRKHFQVVVPGMAEEAQGPTYFFDAGGSGSFAGWQARTGYYTSKAGIPVADIDPKYANRSSLFVFKNPLIPFNLIPYQITSETGSTRCFREISDPRSDYRFTLLDSSTLSGNNKFDGYTNYHLPKIPPGYRYVAKIGNVCNQAEAEGLIYEFTPTTVQDMLVVKYAMVLPSPHHGLSDVLKQQNPPFELSIEIKNPFTGEWEISPASRCAYTFVNASDDITLTDTAYHNDGITSGGAVVIYRTWTTIGVDLSQMAQSNLPARLLVTSGDCSPGGHWGYSYVTGMLTSSKPIVEYNTKNMNSDFVASATVPEGFTYKWTIKDSSTVFSTERIFNVPERLMDNNGQREFTCHISSVVTNCPDSLKARCMGTPKLLDVFIENRRAVVSMVDTLLGDKEMRFQSTSSVYNGAVLLPNKYVWDFGDGTIITDTTDMITHEYLKAGTYKVTLTVYSSHSETGECATQKVFTVKVLGTAEEIVQNGKEWAVVVKDNNAASENGYTIIYFFQGDTLIENVSYKALYSSRNKDKSNASIEGFLREYKGKVYARKREWNNGNISTEGLLYDFSLQTGDTVTVQNKFYSKLGSHLTVDAVVKNIDGQGLNAYYLTLEESGESIRADIWYSGIGSHCGIINVVADLYYGTSKSELLCCKDSVGTLLYQNPKYNSCYYSGIETYLQEKESLKVSPNPVKDYIKLEINSAKTEKYTFKLFDGKGNIVLQKEVEGKTDEISTKELLPGIYFYSLNNKEMTVFERGKIVKVK